MSIRLFAAALAICVTPFTARAADDDNPYKTVKVGDFATYTMAVKVGPLNLAGSTTQSVTAKSEKEATIKVIATINGMEAPAQEQKIDLTKPYDPTKASGLPQGVEATVEKIKDGKEKIKVANKEYDCVWTTYKVKAKAGGMDVDAEVKVWMSKEVPMGMVKMVMTADVAKMKMEMTMDLSESGNKK